MVLIHVREIAYLLLCLLLFNCKSNENENNTNSSIVTETEKTIANLKYLQVNGTDIWVRNKARTGDVIMKINNNPKVQVLDSCCFETIRGNSSYWYKINYRDSIGWFFGSQTKEFSEREQKQLRASITEPKQLLKRINSNKSLVKFQGFGTEPFWNIYITDDELLFDDGYDNYKSYKLVNEFIPNEKAQSIKAKNIESTLEFEILKKSSSDGMSDRNFPYKITIDKSQPHLNGVGYTDKSQITESRIIYYDSYFDVCDEDKAVYYREIVLDGKNKPVGVVKDYYINGALRWEGQYLS